MLSALTGTVRVSDELHAQFRGGVAEGPHDAGAVRFPPDLVLDAGGDPFDLLIFLRLGGGPVGPDPHLRGLPGQGLVFGLQAMDVEGAEAFGRPGSEHEEDHHHE